ncbi:MAG: VCBS domain-containing protein [Sandarakinorhabdus sp.]
MTQTIYTGTAGADLLDASGEGAKDSAVFRSVGAGDTVLGGAGNDRAALSGAGALVNLDAGNDLFLAVLDGRVNTTYDVIDGGAGSDTLNITVNGNQLTSAVNAELVRLQTYLAGDTTQHFVSDMLHIDMVNVETSNIRVDGGVKTLAEVAPVAVNHAATIGGSAAGSVTEDGTLTATGTLTVTDLDAGQAAFQAITGAALVKTYGSFSFDAATGAWGYTLNNTAANVQTLAAAQTVTDTLHVTSLDGSAGQDITVSINGAAEASAPTTLTFANGSFVGDAYGYTSLYTESGFKVSAASSGGFYVQVPNYGPQFTSKALNASGGTDLFIKKTDGSIFSFDSVQVYGRSADNDSATPLQILGLDHGVQKYSYDVAIRSPLHKVDFGWTGIDQITIHPGQDGFMMTGAIFDDFMFH